MTETHVYSLTVRYNGTRYKGWQRQPDTATIQGTLEACLAEYLGCPVSLAGCGRTDTGVHALAHVSSFVTATPLDCESLRAALEASLPVDIIVTDCARRPPGFHARFSAVGKRYRYTIRHVRPRAADFPQPHDVWPSRWPLVAAWMRQGARHLVGRHDFFSLASRGARHESTVRTITALTVRRRREFPDTIDIDVTGEGFLYHMVRTIAGTLVEVGRGKWPPAICAELLSIRDRAQGGTTLPARGLTLLEALY